MHFIKENFVKNVSKIYKIIKFLTFLKQKIFLIGNSQAIQAFVGLGLIVIVILIIVMIKIYKIMKKFELFKKKSNKLDGYNEKNKTPNRQTSVNTILLLRTMSKPNRSFRNLVYKNYKKVLTKFLKNPFNIIVQWFIIISLTVVQIIFIHYDEKYFKYFGKEDIYSSTFVLWQCDKLDKYLFEELIYAFFVVINTIIIFFIQKKKRFSERIMRKYKNYFQELTNLESDQIEKHKKFIENNKKQDLKKINKIFKFDFLRKVSKNLKNKEFPTPSIPYSSIRRSYTAAVYVIYTYDVLNILMSVYTDNLSSSFISNVSAISGVFVDLIFQILQVFLIGIKFYPILVAADADPNIVIYIFTTLYLFFIVLVRFSNKALCSQKQHYAKKTLIKLSSSLRDKFMSGLELRYNISNKILAILTEDENPNEKYIRAVKHLIPTRFEETFGINQKLNKPGLPEDFELADGFKPPNIYYNNFYSISNQKSKPVEYQLNATKSSHGFRSSLKNQTLTIIDDKIDVISYKFGDFWENSISVLENLPLYIALSFLLTKFTLRTFNCIIDRFNKNQYPDENDTNENEGLAGHIFIEPNKRAKQEFESENYKYFSNFFEKKSFFSQDNRKANNDPADINKYAEKSKFFRDNEKMSYFLNKFETIVYKNIPHLKYSKQFINTYTVGFMIIYFFTLYGIKISAAISHLIAKIYYLFFKFLLIDHSTYINIDKFNFRTEFRLTCIFTSMVIIAQLLFSIRKFRKNLIELKKGKNGQSLFYFLIGKNKQEIVTEYKKAVKKKVKDLEEVTNNSLHFPGYLISHLVYGYGLVFIGVFICVLTLKFIYYLPRVLASIIQLLIPLFVIIFIKYFLIRGITGSVILDKKSNTIKKIAPFYIASYFNFFLDCFIGFAFCLSRINLTNLINLLSLTRIDTPMINQESRFKDLDKAYSAYISYVKMEHYYNNPIVNGFCELLVESMISSKEFQKKFNKKKQKEQIFSRSISLKYDSKITNVQEYNIKNYDEKETKKKRRISYNEVRMPEDKQFNPKFEYNSFLRLRNLLLLWVFLKNNRALGKFRHRNFKTSPNYRKHESKIQAINRLCSCTRNEK